MREKIQLGSILVAGALLRLFGIAFNGTQDMESWIFDWGSKVVDTGLAQAFDAAGAYGLFSYAIAGLGTKFALEFPRFWFSYHKFLEICFDAGICYLLYQLAPKGKKQLAVILFWLGPWFIIIAWNGYWDSANTFWAVLAVYIISRAARREKLPNFRPWILAGLALTVAVMMKPQGFAYFVVGAVILLGVQFIRYANPTVIFFTGTIGGIMVAVGITLGLTGGHIDAVFVPYYHLSSYMPNLSNHSINVWRAVSEFLCYALDQPVAVYDLKLPGNTKEILNTLSMWIALGIVVLMAFRLPLPRRRTNDLALVVKVFKPLAFTLLGIAALIGITQSQYLLGSLSGFAPGYRRFIVFLIAVIVVLATKPQIVTGWIPRFARGVDRAWSSLEKRFAQAPVEQPLEFKLLVIMIASSLAISQFGAKAHENHSYAGLVLLVPLAAYRRRILIPWLVTTLAHFYIQAGGARTGKTSVMPLFLDDYVNRPSAQMVIQGIREWQQSGGDWIITMQVHVNNFLHSMLPVTRPIVFVLTTLVFISVVWIFIELFRSASDKQTVSFLDNGANRDS